MPRYEFRIVGQLDPATLAAFPGFTASTEPVETVLSGKVEDPDQVAALLEEIQNLGLQLVEMRQLPAHPTDEDTQEES